MRKLASIQTIHALRPIPDADAIEVASILGWYVVVKRGEFKVGDQVVYCEIDSILPDRPEFEFLRARGMRVRTIKLRGQISQGICFPLSVLPEGIDLCDGMDCTELLGVVKYEPIVPTNLAGNPRGNFPSFIPKTDEPRVQGLYRVLNDYSGASCYVTEKLDGSSVTMYINDGHFGVCSRNLELYQTEDNAYWQQAVVLDIENKLKSLASNIALQGELIGQGIQGNKLKLNNKTVMFYNVFFIDEQRYATFSEFTEIINTLGLQTVPILHTDYKLESDVNAIVSMATMRSTLNSSVWAEGIVIRLHDQVKYSHDFPSRRVSFKAINPQFLLKYDE